MAEKATDIPNSSTWGSNVLKRDNIYVVFGLSLYQSVLLQNERTQNIVYEKKNMTVLL